MNCPECGKEMENIGMFEDLWFCHGCGRTELPPRLCPDCKNPMQWEDYPEKRERMWVCKNPGCAIREITQWNPEVKP